ncbi:DUF3341 domain-containing protein [Mucilaginibacter sp. SMC90]|uniref:quinol:electron acceptor oxidoreductase subunit ActD n=1 Tax=Mucilaginibacter sp. SMC90 TaxID=2929803 RepID=UPI001FB3F837|nr:quinol:electron acceptor oxidoreductase subunit ActD [Mucilaginibacter sp. SMC90]UOE47440.1 DUF3341 domain-containing protein [Mucilaginibacter sp. SMC90]
MAVHYKTEETRTGNQSSHLISKAAGGFLLCHFSHAEDLLFGIEALQSFHIPIHEVYTPVHIEGLKYKLRLKELKRGYIALKYGCFGGAVLAPLVLYTLTHNWHLPLLGNEIIVTVLTSLFMLGAFICASWLMTTKPPRIIRLPVIDYRFAIVLKTSYIVMDEGVASFLQYSGSVEIARAVKRMLSR